jgi:hypothetical protein
MGNSPEEQLDRLYNANSEAERHIQRLHQDKREAAKTGNLNTVRRIEGSIEEYRAEIRNRNERIRKLENR